MCYHCLENVDTDQECTPETPYNFIGLEDPENNDRRIECRKLFETEIFVRNSLDKDF